MPHRNGRHSTKSKLGCPVEFSAEATEIHYDHSLLDDRPPLTNAVTLAMLRRDCENLIGRAGDGSSMTGLVTQLIMEPQVNFRPWKQLPIS